MGAEMTNEQIEIIHELARDDAIRLVDAGDIQTWKAICESIQRLARAGAILPINTLQFYTAIRWNFSSRRYVAKELQAGRVAKL